jgi:hypothetical protein
MLALRFDLVMIFSGPFAPKFIADAFVASENVGEGGPGDAVRVVGAMARDWRERARGIIFRRQQCRCSRFATCGAGGRQYAVAGQCQEYLLRLMRRSLPKWSVHLASHIPPGRESIAHRKTSRRLGSVQWSSSTMCNCSDNFVQLPAGFDYMVHSSRYFILGFCDSVDFIFGFGLSYRYNTYSIPLPTRMLYTGETNLYHS